MLLFKAIRINTTRKSFYISFEFLLGEIEEDLTQALKYLREILNNNIQLGVILIDKVESIRSIVVSIFLKQKVLLYIQYTNKSISKYCKVYFNTNKEQKEFIKEQNSLVVLLIVERYKENYTKFKTK